MINRGGVLVEQPLVPLIQFQNDFLKAEKDTLQKFHRGHFWPCRFNALVIRVMYVPVFSEPTLASVVIYYAELQWSRVHCCGPVCDGPEPGCGEQHHLQWTLISIHSDS